MRKSFLIFCIALIICIGSLISISYIIIYENDNFSISENIISGDKISASGLSIETNCCSDSHMFWKNTYTISKKNISTTDYKYSYKKKINDSINDSYLSFNPMINTNSSVYSNMFKYSQIYPEGKTHCVLYIKQDTSNNRIVMVTSENGLGWLVIMNAQTNEVIQKLQIITADSETDYLGISNIYIYDDFIAILDTKGIISLAVLNKETNEYYLALKTQSVLNSNNESPFDSLTGLAWHGEKLAAVTYDKQYFHGDDTYYLDLKCSFLVYIFDINGSVIYNGQYYNSLDAENKDFSKNDGSEVIYSGANKFSRCRPVKDTPIIVNWN